MARLIDAVLGQVIQAGDTQTLDHGKENPLEEDVGEPTQSSSGTQKTPRGRTFDFAHDEGSDEDDDEDTEETDENAEPEASPFSPVRPNNSKRRRENVPAPARDLPPRPGRPLFFYGQQ